MDGGQEVERNRAAQAVSAKVHTRVGECVSYGEPEEHTSIETGSAAWLRQHRTNVCVGRFSAIPERRDVVRIRGIFGVRGGRSGSWQRGQTVLEMALMLPLLLLLLVGVIEIGRYAYFDILISNAARAGAQYGAQSVIHAFDSAGIKNAAHDDGLAAMTITPTQQCSCSPTATPVDCGGNGIGCAQTLVYVQVQATDTYNSLFSYPGIPRSMTLSSTVKMRVSQ